MELYTIEEAKRRLGWTDSAYRALKRRGLRVMKSGKRCYLSGREILRFLEQDSKSQLSLGQLETDSDG